jgi:ketosteroid isomerase-like protein
MGSRGHLPLIALAALGACSQPATLPTATAVGVTEAEAAKAFEATVQGWQSMDAARIKGLYAPDVAGFDYSYPGIVTDRAQWDKNQEAFASAKLDKVSVDEKKIQLLGPDAFVVTSLSTGTSTALPANRTIFRCTDVYRQEADGAWLIVNENCAPGISPAL